MSRQQGSLKLDYNIEPRAAAPLDAREVVDLYADLTAPATFPYPYAGLKVYVREEGAVYLLQGPDPTQPAAWTRLGSNGSGGDYQTIKLSDIDKLFVNTTP